MKFIIGSALSLYSLNSYSIGYNCNLTVNGDLKNSKSFIFDSSLPVKEENGLFTADLEIVNIGSENLPDKKLKVSLLKGEDYSMAIFEPGTEHPFLSSKINGDFAQIQCWAKEGE